jgi:outer membrane protein assembly factor BamB
MSALQARRRLLATLLGGTLLAVAACSSVDKADKPTPLKALRLGDGPVRAWSTGIGGEKPKLRLGLAPVVDAQRVYVANAAGEVVALDIATGKRAWSHAVWTRKPKGQLSGGPGVGEGLVVVGSANGDLYALSAADGAERWHARVNAEIQAAPAIGGGVVVLRTVDGHLFGFNAATGEQRWITDQQVPRLSLRGTSSPVIAGDLAIAGFDNGRLMAVSLGGGTTAWDVPLGQPHGSSELQRLIDIDSPPVVEGDELYAVSFQGRAARLALDTGRELWSHEVSSYRGLALGPISAYVSTAEGDVVRLDRAGGGERWRQKLLAHRRLGRPVVAGDSVVVGDNEGFLHWLSAEDGAPQARVKLGAALTSAPIVAGDAANPLVIVQTDKGSVEAWRLKR